MKKLNEIIIENLQRVIADLLDQRLYINHKITALEQAIQALED